MRTNNVPVSSLLNVAIFCLIAAAPLLAQTTQTAATLAGTVVLDGDTPLANATVLFVRIPLLARNAAGKIERLEPIYSSEISTQADGSFSVGNVPLGDYALCAAGPAANHLRSCDWDGSITRVHLSGADTDPHPTLAVRTGALLAFVVADPASRVHVLDPTGTRSSETNLIVNARSGQFFQRALLVSQGAGQVTYQATVPIGVPIQIVVSTNLSVLDASGAMVVTGKPIEGVITVPSSGLQFNLSVE